MAMTQQPIFVTGVPRSGTSWIGDILSTARGVRLNHEGLNPTSNRLVERHHLYRAADDADERLATAADGIFRGRIRFDQFLRGVRWGYWWRTIRPADRVLLKDPTATLLAEWIDRRYEPKVLVIIRHPC